MSEPAAVRRLERITDRLVEEIADLRFSSPVAYVYNPLVYARAPHRRYVRRYAGRGATTLLLGMNPGPWGMAQTGVPFGTVSLVRDWLEVEGRVEEPVRMHPKRPVLGFECGREEISGSRLWGWARDRFGTPQRFFEKFFVHNYCPFQFLDEGGRNLTPDKLKAAERRRLEAPCDRALRDWVETLGVDRVIGIGTFAEGRARQALRGLDVEIHRILHPSPASPLANRGWAERAERQLREIGLRLEG